MSKVRFLEQDPVPTSLRGREGRVEQLTGRGAAVWVDGIRRHVPKDWLVTPSQPEQVITAQPFQESTLQPDPASPQPTSPDVSSGEDGDDDPITMQAWDDIQRACLELGMDWGQSQEFIAETIGISLVELDPFRITWRHFLRVIERLEQLEADQGQQPQTTPPPLPPPPQTTNGDAAKAIYPPPSRYLGVTAYNEMVAIAANLGLSEASMVSQLGIPADCPGYLLDRPWIFAIVRGLAAIATGRQPGQPVLSKAVLKFGYRSDDGPRLVVVGLDGTLLHGDPVIVLDWARQLRIFIESPNAGHSIASGGIPQPAGGKDPANSQMVGEDPATTIRPEDSLPRRAQDSGLQYTLVGSPTTSSTGASKTRTPQGQPVAAVSWSDDDPVVDRGWYKLMEICCEAGVTVEHIRQVLSDATGIPESHVEEAPLTRSRYQRAMAYLANYRCGTGDR